MKFFFKSILFLVLSFAILRCAYEESLTETDQNGLLTDFGLLTEEDPNAPTEFPPWVDWINNHIQPIRSLSATNFQDLGFFSPLVDDKNIVLLGESAHGVKEYTQSKIRLIKYFHQELGFNLIAFESSLYECYKAQRNIELLGSQELIENSLVFVWHTSDMLDLFNYIRQTQSSDNPLVLVGLDVLVSSLDGVGDRPNFYREIIEKVDVDYSQQVFEFDADYITQRSNDFFYNQYVKDNQDVLLEQYEKLVAFFDQNMAQLNNFYVSDPLPPLIARQAAWSTLQEIRRMVSLLLSNTVTAFEIKDLGMVENLNFFMEEAYPGSKAIVWAHNRHTRYKKSGVINETDAKNMAYFFAEQRNDIYSIGLYMYRGTAAFNDRGIYDISRAKSGSMESIFYRTRRKYSFLNLAGEPPVLGNRWINELIIAKSWGTIELFMVLTDQYDGILFIDTVSPPDYLN